MTTHDDIIAHRKCESAELAEELLDAISELMDFNSIEEESLL